MKCQGKDAVLSMRPHGGRNDFSWASAKASHAVLLCEMERGTVDWSNRSRIDRIRRAQASVIPVVISKIGLEIKTHTANHGTASHIRQVCAQILLTMSPMARP